MVTNSSTAAAAKPPIPRSSNSPSAGTTAISVCFSHNVSEANSRAYLSRQASSVALSVTVNDPVSASRTTVRSLSGIRSRLMSRSATSRLLSTERRSDTNRQLPTRRGVDRDRPLRIGFVDVDDEHVTGVGFDVVVVGDLGRSGVPDPPVPTRPACESACRPTPHSARRRARQRPPAPRDGSATACPCRGRRCRHRRVRRRYG